MRIRVVMAVVSCLWLAGCKQEVYGDLSQRDANEMVAALRVNGVEAERKAQNDKFRVMVSDRDFTRAVQILSSAGLPRLSYRTVEQVFPGDKMIISPVEQRARYLFALSEELSRTISYIDGVRIARVHLVMPEADIRGRTTGRASASVLVQLTPGSEAAVVTPFVRSVVANAVPNIKPTDINIVASYQPPTTNQQQ